MTERRYDIDGLRVLIMLAVYFFHCARFFGGGTWHLNNAKESIVALVFIAWLDMWFMPFFFLLSGFGCWHSLQSRTNKQFLLTRTKRILVPLYTVGLFLLLPPQFFFEIYSNMDYKGTFWGMLPIYFSRLGHFSFDWPGGLLPLPFSGHLWFLQYLALISLVTLPLLRFLRSEQGFHLIDKLAGFFNRRGGVFIILIPLFLVRIGFRSFIWGEHSWADFLEFIVFFVTGYIFAADTRFTQSVKRHGGICLALGLIGTGTEAVFVLGLDYSYPGGEPFSLAFVLFESIMSIGRWGWIVFVLSLGAKYLNADNKVLAYSNEAVLPFYIFHQTVILCVGWFVIPWNINILPKYLIIALTSFALIMILYDCVVRRLNVLRILFGMRPKEVKGVGQK